MDFSYYSTEHYQNKGNLPMQAAGVTSQEDFPNHHPLFSMSEAQFNTHSCKHREGRRLPMATKSWAE